MLANLKQFQEIQNSINEGKVSNTQTLNSVTEDNWTGIEIVSPTRLKFHFSKFDSEFMYKLATTNLAVYAKDKYSGPYKLKNWDPGQKITLTKNEFYWKKNDRPDLEISFVSEDSVALRLYQSNKLDFLRRLPSQYIPEFKNLPQFTWLQVARLDYWAFGPMFEKSSRQRELLSTSLNFPDLKAIFNSEGMPGCTGLPAAWSKGEVCIQPDTKIATPNAAKATTANDLKDPPIAFPKIEWPVGIAYHYSSQGGEDHKRSAEWLQEQWRDHLGLAVEVKGLDNKIYLQNLQTNPSAIYRKGVALSRPTCLAALETFIDVGSKGFKIKDPALIKKIQGLNNEFSFEKKASICHQILNQIILDQHLLIPTGPMHFAMLFNLKFKGWKLNTLNYLDLSELQEVAETTKQK